MLTFELRDVLMSRLEKIEGMLQDTPEDPFLRYAYAMELAKLDQFEAAQTAFAAVREVDPNYVPAFFQEGQMLARAEKIPAAKEILRLGIDVAIANGDDHALGEMTEFLAALD